MKKVVFTVIVSDYDDLKEPEYFNETWDHICFTDQDITSKLWKIVKIPKGGKKTSRKYKILNQFPNYDVSVYLDATFQIINDLDKFALSKTEGIWLNQHTQRHTVVEEAKIIKLKNIDSSEVINSQISRYDSEGFPDESGLWRCGIIVRNPKDSSITKLCEDWWDEIEAGSWRDQVSFPYVCWKNNITPSPILHGISSIYFKQHLHKVRPEDEIVFIKSANTPAQQVHCIVTEEGISVPKWLLNYIPYQSKDEIIRTIKLLNGTVVYG